MRNEFEGQRDYIFELYDEYRVEEFLLKKKETKTLEYRITKDHIITSLVKEIKDNTQILLISNILFVVILFIYLIGVIANPLIAPILIGTLAFSSVASFVKIFKTVTKYGSSISKHENNYREFLDSIKDTNDESLSDKKEMIITLGNALIKRIEHNEPEEVNEINNLNVLVKEFTIDEKITKDNKENTYIKVRK